VLAAVTRPALSEVLAINHAARIGEYQLRGRDVAAAKTVLRDL
jgi:hypothetical protein